MSGHGREVFVFPTADDVAKAAAERMVAVLSDCLGPAAVCLSGGATPQLLFKALSASPWRESIAWKRVHWFVGDERLVPMSSADSNMGTAERLFLHALAPAQNIHRVRTDAARPGEIYEADLRQFRATLDGDAPLFECVILGVGQDGHTASLFPGSVVLSEKKRWVVDVPEPAVPPLVPRITLTPPCLGSTRNMMFLVTGHGKREIMRSVLAGDDLPATRVSAAFGKTTWLIDQAASPDIDRPSASGLKV